MFDRLTEVEVRRINAIVYANYGEPNARIVLGRDWDFPDVRTQEQNRLIGQKIQEFAAETRRGIEEKEQRQVMRIKASIREYYHTKDEGAKREFEEANTLYPFLFSRAWMELKQENARNAVAVAAPLPVSEQTPPSEAEVVAPPEDVLYPLDAELRDRVLDIEKLIIDLGRDLQLLRAEGSADDILLQTCRKLVTRAKESLSGRQAAEFSVRRLDMTRNSLMTTWRQVKSRLKRS